MVVGKTDRKNNLVVVQCSLGRTYYNYWNKTSKETNENIYNAMQHGLGEGKDYNPSYKEGIRQDRIIGKDLANRPGGRAGKRRTSTSKPSLKNVCKFRFAIKLDPGKCWYIKKTDSKDLFSHNHPKPVTEAIIRRNSTISDKEKETIRLYHTHANGGSAQCIANASQEDGLFLTRPQVRRIYREVDDSSYSVNPNDVPAPPSC
jgi:hypothetical protein